ncbi:hypothetical protein [uncultured Shewanella sp.]|uniref:hypothetical protein n=1 Tax=uncultured Shewanella sp. TaxID=173975 RepID=UPI00262DA561|nr:hypothetical protein [uncultured Shewanella sp.]
MLPFKLFDKLLTQLTYVIATLMQHKKVSAYNIIGKSHDCGSKEGYMLANLEYGLMHSDTKNALNQFINNYANKSVNLVA